MGSFCNVEPETVFESELCPNCGVYVTVKQIGCDDEESFMIPSALAEVPKDLEICAVVSAANVTTSPKYNTLCGFGMWSAKSRNTCSLLSGLGQMARNA